MKFLTTFLLTILMTFCLAKEVRYKADGRSDCSSFATLASTKWISSGDTATVIFNSNDHQGKSVNCYMKFTNSLFDDKKMSVMFNSSHRSILDTSSISFYDDDDTDIDDLLRTVSKAQRVPRDLKIFTTGNDLTIRFRAPSNANHDVVFTINNISNSGVTSTLSLLTLLAVVAVKLL